MTSRPRRARAAPAAAAPPSAPAGPSTLDCFAIVAPGLEPFALAEARAIGLPAELEPGGGGVAWRGDLASVVRANVALRVASRVVVRLAAFEARSFAELERHARQIPWTRVVVPGGAVRFRVTCKKSRLYHSDAVAQRLADAVTRAVAGVRAEGASGPDDEGAGDEDAALFVVRVLRDRCTVSADASGALLHRRGYRQATAKAPLRETLAAALLAASEWDRAAPLVDPMCGSGTIPVEAALAARGIPAGAARGFAVERWPGVSPELVRRVREQLAPGSPGGAGGAGALIVGSDRDAGAIEAARANAARAGVQDDLSLSVRSLSAAELPGSDRGWVVSNPPYGVRVGEADRVRDLWAQLGHVLRERGRGWRLALLSPDPALDRQLRIPVRTVAATGNGGIPVRIIVGEVP